MNFWFCQKHNSKLFIILNYTDNFLLNLPTSRGLQLMLLSNNFLFIVFIKI